MQTFIYPGWSVLYKCLINFNSNNSNNNHWLYVYSESKQKSIDRHTKHMHTPKNKYVEKIIKAQNRIRLCRCANTLWTCSHKLNIFIWIVTQIYTHMNGIAVSNQSLSGMRECLTQWKWFQCWKYYCCNQYKLIQFWLQLSIS